jgi:hypothetical protein
MNRKTTPKVVNGRVQKKNSTRCSPDYYFDPQPEIVIDRRKPGPGARHLLSVEDIRRYIGLIPEWGRLSEGLNAIVLTPYDDNSFGRYNELGVIKLSAWPRSLWIELHQDVLPRKQALVERMGVLTEELPWGLLCKFTEPQAKAFQLLGTFLHELGHHCDRMSTRSKVSSSNGEPFALQFEHEWQVKLWEPYCRTFGL